MLAADVNVVADGGGKVRGKGGALGAEKTARALMAGIPPMLEMGFLIEQHEVNGQPGAIVRSPDGKVVAAWSLEILDDQIQTIHSVNNPEKLSHLGPVGDLNGLIRARNRLQRPAAE
jgi:RNA polymerase sigma-70 factor (ECF subfamily)